MAAIVASAATALVASVRSVAADTGPPPSDGMVASDQFSIGLAIGALLVLTTLVVAARVRGSRRWIAAVGILGVTAVGLFVTLLVGTVGGWSGEPMAPWTIPAMIAAGVGGVLLAGLVVLRYQPA